VTEPDQADKSAPAEPDELLAEIARTRARLGRKIGALRDRLLDGTDRARPLKEKKTMAEKKGKSEEHGKKKTAPKKSASKQSAPSKSKSAKKSSTRHGPAAKPTMTSVARKTKKVLGDALAGAAAGAVQGAAAAILPDVKNAEEKQPACE